MVRRPCLTPLVLIRYVGHLPHLRGFAAHHQHFQAVIVIQVNVQRGEDGVVEIVLDAR